MFDFFKKKTVDASASVQSPVYDFLYCDTRRVESFLGQLTPAGYLTTQRSITSNKRGHGSKASVGGGVLAAGLSGELSNESGQQSEETYDPFWAGATSLLVRLEDRKLLKHDLHQANIGQLVLASGALRLFDLRVMKEVLAAPKLGKKVGIGDTSRMTPEKIEENELAYEFVKVMPHTVQAQIICPEEGGRKLSAAWMTLNPDSMLVPPGDILMKFGHLVPGWKMLGIKDAGIDGGPQIDPEMADRFRAGELGSLADKRHSTPLAILAEYMAPIARKAMGRPGIYYGVTPILIFREVIG